MRQKEEVASGSPKILLAPQLNLVERSSVKHVDHAFGIYSDLLRTYCADRMMAS